MSVLTSEAVILRTWPVQEADLIVSFFTRDYGRVKGVAKSALRSRKRFGGALEPMTLARAWFAEKPRQELVRLDQLEILRSPLSSPVDHARMAVLSFYAEVLDEALPEHDPQDAVFRLLVSVLEQTNAVQPETVQRESSGPPSSGPWMPLTYFSLWMTRRSSAPLDNGAERPLPPPPRPSPVENLASTRLRARPRSPPPRPPAARRPPAVDARSLRSVGRQGQSASAPALRNRMVAPARERPHCANGLNRSRGRGGERAEGAYG